MKKKYIISFTLSLVMSLLCAPLRAWGFTNASIIETIFYLIITYMILRKLSDNKSETKIITIAIIAGRICLELPLRIIHFNETLISLPSTSLACLSILLAAFIYTIKHKKHIVLFAILAWSCCVFWGHKKCLQYMIWGISTPQVNLSSFEITTGKEKATFGSLKEEYILLDFWNSGCGVCFKKFPEIQFLYNKNKNKMTIASVFVPRFKNEQESDGKPIIDKYGYTFPVWSVSPKDTLLKILKIEFFPTVILLDKDKNVIFRGNLDNAKKELEDIID